MMSGQLAGQSEGGSWFGKTPRHHHIEACTPGRFTNHHFGVHGNGDHPICPAKQRARSLQRINSLASSIGERYVKIRAVKGNDQAGNACPRAEI